MTYQVGFTQHSPESSPGYRIQGKLKNAANKTIYLTEDSFYKNEQKKDSTVANSYEELLFTGKLDEITLYYISLAHNGPRKDFYLENSIIQFTGDATAIHSATLTGSWQEQVRDQVGKMLRDNAKSNRFKSARIAYEKARKLKLASRPRISLRLLRRGQGLSLN